MTDFLATILDMRSGKVAQDCNNKFNEVLQAVRDTGGNGKFTINLLIKPSKMGMGGAVIEVEMEHNTKVVKPELAVGRSFFFVNDKGDLTREDPETEDMFATEEPINERKQS